MDTFNEFDSKATIPDKNVGSIISHAFEIYKGIFIYPLVAGLIFFIIISILMSVTGLISVFMDLSQSSAGSYNPEAYREIYTSSPFLYFAGGASLINILIFSPLIVGVIYMAHKSNNKQTLQFSDLFIGYKQNTIQIIIFGVLFAIATVISTQLCYIPGIIIMPFLFLGYPFLLFQNVSALEALKKSFEIVKNNYLDFLLLNLLAYLCSSLGIIACCIGIIVTYLFYYSTMYSAYLAYVAVPKQIETDLK